MSKAEKTITAWDARLREAAARMEDAASRVEQDLRKLVTYVNDEVVPDVRRNGSAALRSAADELHRLARHMDEANTGTHAAPPPPPPGDKP